jgi:thiol-disulfide isomerase/thioredoxin
MTIGKPFRIAVGSALVALGLCAPVRAGDPGGAAPEFTLPSRAGTPVSLASLRGQVVMINFWASWCGPCRQEFPLLDQIHRKYQPLGFAMLGVNVEPDLADAERFLQQTPVGFPILFDPGNAVTRQYGVSGMPTTILVDRKGRVRWLHRAYRPGDEDEYIARIRALLREPA